VLEGSQGSRRVLKIQLAAADLMPDVVADRLEGRFLDDRHFDRIVRETATVLKPNGSPLLIYAKDALPRRLCEIAFDVFRQVRQTSANRGMAAGLPHMRRIKRDGTRSRTRQTSPVPSAVVGYLDRAPRIPVCRMTAFTRDHFEEFERARPFIAAVSRAFRDLAPDRWAVQRAFVDQVSSPFVIPGTVFSTLTINRDWRTAAHRDAGDLRTGFGVMTVLAAGADYDGFELIFPRYRVAVDVRTGGVCLADVHELHGNAPVRWSGGRFVRVSVIAYVRERMRECRSAADEIELARHRGQRE
jgi:hypothetical protein